jgi:DNA polymerase-3 subunit gamma/tau
LDTLEKIYAGGFDPSVFVQDFLDLIRHAVMIRTQAEHARKLVDLADSEIEEIRTITAGLSPEDMHLIFDMGLKGANDLVRSQNPRVVLEMLLLRMSQAPRLQEIGTLLGQSTPVQPIPAAAAKSSMEKPIVAAPSPMIAPGATVSPTPQISNEAPLKEKNWHQLVEKLRPIAPQLAAKLEYVALLENSQKKIRLGVKESLMQLQLSEKVTLQKIQNYLKTFWGFDGEVSVEQVKSDQAPPSIKESIEKKSQEDHEALLKQVEQHPTIQQTQSMFKTKITSIKEQQ